MSVLNLNTSTKSFLTATVKVADPNKPGDVMFAGYPCRIDGSKLQAGDARIPTYRDLYTGKTYAKIAEVIPTATDAASVEVAQAINAQKPIHYVSDDGSVRGWFVEAPNFDQSAEQAVVVEPAPVRVLLPNPALVPLA
jgi:hypothetical protein